MNWCRIVSPASATALALATFSPIATLSAQLTLREAIRQADRAAFVNRIASAETEAQRAKAISPLKGILPTVHFDAGYVRTTDPIGVFGATLRQRSVSQASFDPQRLNYPDALGNYQSAIVLEQPILNADAWEGRHSANYAVDASRSSEEWTRLSTRADVVRAYYGAVLAEERVATLRSASKAAQAHVSQANALVRQGVATKSDALLASVREGDVNAQLAEAEGAASNARRSLAVLLGQDAADPGVRVTATSLPSSDRIRATIASDTAEVVPAERADVRAALNGFEAARANATRARSLIVPRVNAFARYDWYSATNPVAGNRNWTVGVMASWVPFTNPSDISDMREAGARSDAARAQAEGAQANARLDLQQTRTALKVALERLTIAESAVAQGAEAHRIVSRKYQGGLAQIVELLDAEAVETQSALGFSQARWAAIAAATDRRRALGKDPASLETLDSPLDTSQSTTTKD